MECPYFRPKRNFNPRPPWGGRLSVQFSALSFTPFQSTPSVGRATEYVNRIKHLDNISIHALRGEGDVHKMRAFWVFFFISIHALRGEGDALRHLHLTHLSVFQSTPSVGRAT